MNDKKLSKADFQKLWGENGPYSEVRLIEEIRILDDAISRVFLVVEVGINPFTYEWIVANRTKFSKDEPIMQLLAHAEFRGDFGYVVSAGEVKLDGEKSRQIAREQALMATETVIRMHEAVIQAFNLQRPSVPKKKMSKKATTVGHIWNEATGQVEVEAISANNDQLLATMTGGTLFFCILTFDVGFAFNKKSVQQFSRAVDVAMNSFTVVIEDCESFATDMLLTIRTDSTNTADTFIKAVIANSNQGAKKPLFQTDYIVTTDKNSKHRLM